MHRFLSLSIAFGATAFALAAHSDEADSTNNGTDPTRLISSAAVVYEHNDLLPDFSRDVIRLDLTLPFGERADYSVRLRVPIVRLDAGGERDPGLGDVSVQLTHVFGLTPQRGMVAQVELVADTAERAELGTGKHVLKGTLIYAKFLSGGIFAPAVVHSASVGGDSGRGDVQSTTFDFYYVPKLADPRTFVTLDPAVTVDWENSGEFASFAATIGRAVGRAFGGNAQVFVKPTVFAGADRPGDWSIELGFKVLGFR